MSRQMKPGAKKALMSLLVIAGLVGLYFVADSFGWIPERISMKSAVPEVGNVPTFTPETTASAPVAQLQLPTMTPTSLNVPPVKALVWAWNSGQSTNFANGGPVTTKGSLMEKYGVKLMLERQDWPDKMREAQIAFAQEFASGNPQPTSGAHFVVIMGDGAPAYLAALNKGLERFGSDYRGVIVYSTGRSYGEDKFMGPAEWKRDPQKARGSLIACVVKDGDWNIVIKWARDNGIPVNTDDRTYDPDAINFRNTPGYIEAAEDMITGVTETRPVVKDGIKTGKTITKKVDGCSTWTPGDVNVVERMDGIVSVASTREYSGQMPSTVIGLSTWVKQNQKTIEGMIQATTEAADQVKYFPSALQKASEISDILYGENKGWQYWAKYYKGEWVEDAGNRIFLGGSLVHNLADNLKLFGLNTGATRPTPYEATYVTFGDVVKSLYPQDVPNYPSIDLALDLTALRTVASRVKSSAPAFEEKYSASGSITNVVSTRSWQIQFRTGQDTFTPQATEQLFELMRDLIITNLSVKVVGHTDSIGNPDANMELSFRRAKAVQTWIEGHAPDKFPTGRITVEYHGQEQPVADNATENGRAQNRRVDIVLGTK